MEDFERYGEKGRTIIYGISKAQYMYALTEMKPYTFWGFHMTAEAQAEIEKTINVLRQHPELLLFDYTDSPLLAEQLPVLGYTCIRTAHGTVVWKRSHVQSIKEQ